MLLYHVHFDVADLEAAEEAFVGAGFPVKARFGYVGREHTRFEPDVSWDAIREQGVRMRLVELERGAVNVVLMRGRAGERRLGQIGYTVDEAERDRVLARAEELGLRTRPDALRSFVTIDRRLDLELTDARRLAYDESALSELQLERLDVASSDPDRAREVLDALVGAEAAGVQFAASGEDFAVLRGAAVSGTAGVEIPV